MAADHDAYFDEVEARFETRARLRPGSRGGVPDPRPRDARAHAGLRGAARRGARAPARAHRRRAVALGDRGLDAAHPALRAGGAAPAAQPRRAVRPRRPRGLRARRLPARIPSRPGRTSRSSTRRTTGSSRSASSTSPGATTPGPRTCMSACAAPDRAIAVCDAHAHVSAAPARAVGQLAVHRGRVDAAALGSHPDLRAHVPALRHPRRVRHLGGAPQLLRGADRHQLHPGVHADLVVGTATSPVRDGGGAHLRRPGRSRGRVSPSRR